MWVAEFVQLTAVADPKFGFFLPLPAATDPKFGLFKHVLGFARIIYSLPEFMSTNCPNWGGSCPPLPPVPYAYVVQHYQRTLS